MSKIGEHAFSTTDWTSRAGIVKAFDCGPGPLQAARDEAWRFYRKYMGNFDPSRNGADVANEVIAALNGYRHPKLRIELYVGPDQSQTDRIFGQIEEALPVCRANGVGLAAVSFYTGQPEPAVWQAMAARNWCGLDPTKDCISVQEYTNNGTVNDSVNVGRFKALIAAGWTGPVAVLEAGMDKCGQPGCGWQTYLTQDQFYQYLHDYDAILQQYPQVLGATVFNAPGWGSFEFHDPLGQFNYSGDASVPNFVIGPGFAAKIQELGWHAASDEVYFSQDANAKLSVVSCDEGLLFYDSANNKVGVLTFN